jgi:hypothetical protein|tara:strand:- start:1323 stop:1601 length:279 start_codon:yes stop_codon:yes gene_type:complete
MLKQQQAELQSDALEMNVNHPSHYTKGKIETWNYITDVLGEYESISVAHAQILKYLGSRLWNKNNPLEDAMKARWYLDEMIRLMEKTKGVNW